MIAMLPRDAFPRNSNNKVANSRSYISWSEAKTPNPPQNCSVYLHNSSSVKRVCLLSIQYHYEGSGSAHFIVTFERHDFMGWFLLASSANVWTAPLDHRAKSLKQNNAGSAAHRCILEPTE